MQLLLHPLVGKREKPYKYFLRRGKFGNNHNIYIKFKDIPKTKPSKVHIPGQKKISGYFQDFGTF